MNIRLFTVGLFALSCSAVATAQVTEATLGDIAGRQIGPAKMSGRISAIDAENANPNIVWVGAAGGGVWKSLNQGTTFKPVFDDYCQSIGCITIDQQHPDTVWVGTGEVWVRNSVSVGNGIYRTADGGDKWEAKGLEKTERIAKILIDPTNANVVYVAALGALWGDSEDRGVYKTTDGGGSWKKLLYGGPSTGCASLAIDPVDPNILYAAMWDFRRQAHTLRSGGPGSGLYKSTDAGATWIHSQHGLPNETLGRIALAISPVAPHTVYALVESDKSALYCSTNQGASWEKMSTQYQMGDRPFYYSLLVPDPVDAKRIYKPGTQLWVSNDGGKIFQSPSATGGSYHSDTHALWISPLDNRLLYMGTDGGVYISADKGNTWRFVQNLPVSQFYHVSVDRKKPYNVYGGLQDNGSWMAPSRKSGGIRNSDWKNIGFGDGFYAYGDPDDPDVTFAQYQGGRISRTNHKTGESKYIKPFPDAGTKPLRFNWNAPVVFGAKTGWLYVGSQYLFRSKDKGDSWERISPDLTTDDPARQQQEKSGGLTIDNSTAENNTTIFCVSESPVDPGIIWVGTDDGNVQLTTDNGKTWNKLNANIAGLPPLAFISHIDADHFNKNAAWMTVDAHRNGDMAPYALYTSDLGKTWKSLVSSSIQGYCQVIKQDPINPDLIFLGTESGLFISLDKGNEWIRFKNKVPQTGVYDIAIQPDEQDVVLATHGRGIIIIDDITPLRNLKKEVLDQDFAFLPQRPFYFLSETGMQDFASDAEYFGPNPTSAASICYYMKKRHVFGEMYLELYDASGKFLKKLPAAGRKGINKVMIATMIEPPKVPKSPNMLAEAMAGLMYEPGNYTVKVVKGDQSYSTTLQLNETPGLKHSAEDRKLQRETAMKAYHMLEKLASADDMILKTKEALVAESAQLKGDKKKRALAKIADCEKMHELISATQPGEGGITGQVRLRENIAEIYGAVVGYQGRPTNLQINALEVYNKQVADFEAKIKQLMLSK